MEDVPPIRRCDRPGCSQEATALLSMDGAAGEVRILRLVAGAPKALTLALCTMHADRLVVPRGWVLHDERDEGHLFAAPGGAASGRAAAGGAATGDPAGTTAGEAAPPAAKKAAKPRAPRKRKAAAPPPDDDGTPGTPDAPEASGAAPTTEAATPAEPVGDPELFADLPPDPAPAPAADPARPAIDLTHAPRESRLLHRAFRAASTREDDEEA